MIEKGTRAKRQQPGGEGGRGGGVWFPPTLRALEFNWPRTLRGSKRSPDDTSQRKTNSHMTWRDQKESGGGGGGLGRGGRRTVGDDNDTFQLLFCKCHSALGFEGWGGESRGCTNPTGLTGHAHTEAFKNTFCLCGCTHTFSSFIISNTLAGPYVYFLRRRHRQKHRLLVFVGCNTLVNPTSSSLHSETYNSRLLLLLLLRQ